MIFSTLPRRLTSRSLRGLNSGVSPYRYQSNVVNLPANPDRQQLASAPTARAMHIQAIPMCKMRRKPSKLLGPLLILCVGQDNYAYLVVDDKSKDAVIIDPASPSE